MSTEYIWKYFVQNNIIGNPLGVAGIMGNLQAESGMCTYRLQGDYSSGYSRSLDYTNKVNSFIISKNDFMYNGPGGGGYGLAQWTYWSRKKTLYEKWFNNRNKYTSIGCVELGCDVLWQELQGYSDVLSTLRTVNSTTLRTYTYKGQTCQIMDGVKQASDSFMTKFERPADQSETAKIGRAKLAQNWYNTYCNVNGGINTPITQEPRINVPIRTTRPENGNIYYNHPPKGVNTCIYGSQLRNCVKELNVLANCVGYACGAYNEMINYVRKQNKQYFALNSDAETFLNTIKNSTEYKNGNIKILGPGEMPQVGGIMVWRNGVRIGDGDGGHVAICTEIIDRNRIRISDSGYGYSAAEAFKNTEKNNSNGRWGQRQALTYLGCICLPNDVQPYVGVDFPSNHPSTVDTVNDFTTYITINGSINGIIDKSKPFYTTALKLFYSYDTDNISVKYDSNSNTYKGNYDGSIDIALGSSQQNNFSVRLDRSRDKGKISIAIYQICNNRQYDTLSKVFTKKLIVTKPIVDICVNGVWKQAVPYIYSKGKWKQVLPHIYHNNNWEELWNVVK